MLRVISTMKPPLVTKLIQIHERIIGPLRASQHKKLLNHVLYSVLHAVCHLSQDCILYYGYCYETEEGFTVLCKRSYKFTYNSH